jgi:hypothetical protein
MTVSRALTRGLEHFQFRRVLRNQDAEDWLKITNTTPAFKLLLLLIFLVTFDHLSYLKSFLKIPYILLQFDLSLKKIEM